jgi:hypothetical protein
MEWTDGKCIRKGMDGMCIVKGDKEGVLGRGYYEETFRKGVLGWDIYNKGK